MIKSFADLHKTVEESLKDKLKLVAIYPTEVKYLEAIKKASDQGIIEPCLIGPEKGLEEVSRNSGIDINMYDIIDAQTPEDAYSKALTRNSESGGFLLKGNVATRHFVDRFFDKKFGFVAGKETLTHVGAIKTERYPKLMFVTDSAVFPNPDAAQLIQIVQNAAGVCRKLGNDMPKAALLAAVEAIYPAIPITMLEAAVAKMSDRGQIKGVLIDGPLSFDVAISTEVAHSKGITNSRVAGDTDIFAMPNMETANGTYKAMVMYAHAEAASVFFGGRVPIATSSAIDSAQNIFNSIVLAAYLA